MSTMRDGPVLKAVADVVKEHVRKAFDVLRGRVDAIEQQIKELPKSERGERGEKGDSGAAGFAGIPGEKGLDGRDGAPGLQGPAGNDGKEGPQGIRGEVGPVGPIGERGEPGGAGKDGSPGKDGQDGLSIKGDAGIDGKDGSDGSDGKDAPPIDAKALADEIVKKVLGQIPPPIKGADGKDGVSIDPDAVRIMVAGEVTKAVAALPKPASGRDGREGKDGREGIPGKDAAEIDYLPGIDESQAYQKGTWAQHRGGTIVAIRTTDPIVDGDLQAAGWVIAQNGIAEMHQSMAPDGRTLITTAVGTDGKAMPMKVKLYVPQYKGVWKDQPYELGDYVTMAGAQWHANRITKDRPGTSDAWTLAVKRGSDGKDLTNGTRQ